MSRLPLSAVQLLALLTLPFVAVLGTSAAQKAIEVRELRARADQVRKEIDTLQARNLDLRRQIDYRRSDGFLEKAAREQLGLIKPSEIPIVVLTNAASAAPTPAAAVSPPARPNYERWWDYFFGPR